MCIRGDALDLIVERSGGYPYFLQEWGYHVWNAAAGSPMSRDEVAGVGEDVTRHLDGNFFHVRLDRLTPAEKNYFRAMAELGAGPHRSGDIAAMLGVKVETAAPRRSALIRKGMVYSPAHGDTTFTVPMFSDFLRRAVDFEPPALPPAEPSRGSVNDAQETLWLDEVK